MIETDQQRRWWFATHPEYSWSRTGQSHNHQDDDEGNDPGKLSPESINPYVDERLNLETDAESGLEWHGTTQDKAEEKAEYDKGWNAGYLAIHFGKVPPDLDPADKSPYARGLRDGAATALDEQEAWRQRWTDPILFLLGSHPSQLLGRKLEEAGKPRPSEDYDAHHIVPWRHWRADEARKILQDWGIKIDSVANGMWLPRPYHWRLSNNYRYMDTVTEMLKMANSKPEAQKILRHIEHLLSTRKFPL